MNPSTTTAPPQADPTFPFTIEDLDYWLILREDGTVVKFTVDNRKSGPVSATTYGPQKAHSLSAYCNHDPAKIPVYSGPAVNLFIADVTGTRKYRKDFDLVIDGGDVLSKWFMDKEIPDIQLTGDPELIELLSKYETYSDTAGPEPRVLKINWADRKAPPLHPEFWVRLAEILTKEGTSEDPYRVLTCCQGGHGRSGTALTALLMCYTDYTPLEAICHLRAIHCPRAIESIVQHDYLNSLATHLGRSPNAHDSAKVQDFKAAFLAMTNPISAPYQARIKGV